MTLRTCFLTGVLIAITVNNTLYPFQFLINLIPLHFHLFHFVFFISSLVILVWNFRGYYIIRRSSYFFKCLFTLSRTKINGNWYFRRNLFFKLKYLCFNRDILDELIWTDQWIFESDWLLVGDWFFEWTKRFYCLWVFWLEVLEVDGGGGVYYFGFKGFVISFISNDRFNISGFIQPHIWIQRHFLKAPSHRLWLLYQRSHRFLV